MDILIWVLYGLAAAIVIVFAVINIVKIAKMPTEERKERIIEFLMGLVAMAEEKWLDTGKGKEKLAWVEAEFSKRAPWLIKIILLVTKSADLHELIEKALERLKASFGK